jgi:hypothetical protein
MRVRPVDSIARKARSNATKRKAMEGISERKKPPYVTNIGQKAHSPAVIAAAGAEIHRRAILHASHGIRHDSAVHMTAAAHNPPRPVPNNFIGIASKPLVICGTKVSPGPRGACSINRRAPST